MFPTAVRRAASSAHDARDNGATALVSSMAQAAIFHGSVCYSMAQAAALNGLACCAAGPVLTFRLQDQ
jgi:hypothetical protein